MPGTYPKKQRVARSVTLPNAVAIREPETKNFCNSLIRSLDDTFRRFSDDIKDSRVYRYTPTGSSDTAGQESDVAYDNSFIYVKAAGGWRRAVLSTF